MNSTIKSWLDKTLALGDSGQPTVSQLSKLKEFGLGLPSAIDGLLLSARTLPDGKIPSKQGLKTIKIHPAIFLANMARQASEISDANLFSDSYMSATYAYGANLALSRLVGVLDEAHTANDNSVNDFQDSKDTSLNLIHNLVQVRSIISEFPGSLQGSDQQKRIDDFYNSETPLSDLELTDELAIRTCGINSYFVAKALSHPSLDFQNYLEKIKAIDVNSPYVYRASYADFLGASICLAQACKSLSHEDKVSKTKEYLAQITSPDKNILRLEFLQASGVIAQPNPFAGNIPRIINDNDKSLITNTIGHAFSYSTSIGISPMAATSMDSNSDAKPLIEDIAKLIYFHTNQASDYAIKYTHSAEDLAKASEEVQNFTRSVTL